MAEPRGGEKGAESREHNEEREGAHSRFNRQHERGAHWLMIRQRVWAVGIIDQPDPLRYRRRHPAFLEGIQFHLIGPAPDAEESLVQYTRGDQRNAGPQKLFVVQKIQDTITVGGSPELSFQRFVIIIRVGNVLVCRREGE